MVGIDVDWDVCGWGYCHDDGIVMMAAEMMLMMAVVIM